MLQWPLSDRNIQGTSWWNIWKLVNGTLERNYTKAKNESIHKKVHESVFKHVLVKTVPWAGMSVKNLTARFSHTAFNPFLIWLFRAIFRWGSAKLHLRSLFLIETCCSNKKKQIYRLSKVYSKIAKNNLLTSAFFMISLSMEVCC